MGIPVAVQRRISPGLAAIDQQAMREAIVEFNKQGRTQFFKRYGFSRSSRVYLIYGQRLYDTKALVAAAYRYATRKTLRHTEFSVGAQTHAVFSRLARQNSNFARTFDDRLGELRNLSTEYDRIPRAWTDLRELGFSKWISLAKFADLKTGWLPGVYVIAHSNRRPNGISIIDKRVVYIGETVDQSLHQRLYQLHRSMFNGKAGHSGGATLRAKGYHRKRLWLAIRSFPLGYGIDDAFAKSFQVSPNQTPRKNAALRIRPNRSCLPAGKLEVKQSRSICYLRRSLFAETELSFAVLDSFPVSKVSFGVYAVAEINVSR